MSTGDPPFPRAITFDLGSTLLSGNGPDIPERCRHLLQLATNCHEIDPGAFVAAGVSLDQDAWAMRDTSPFEFTTLAFIRLLRDDFGLVFDVSLQEVERELYFHGCTSAPTAGVLPALSRLVAKGIPLAVLSNHLFSSDVLHEDLRRHGMDHLFRFVISSADYGIKKPNGRIFMTAAHRLGVGPSAVWHVGDSLAFDVKGARSAGMTAVWYNPSAEAAAPPDGTVCVRDWDSFLAVVDKAAVTNSAHAKD